MTLCIHRLRAAISGRYWDSRSHEITFNAEAGTISVVVGARGTSKTAIALAIGRLIPEPIMGSVSGDILLNSANSPADDLAWKPAVLSQDAIEWTVSDSVFGEIAFSLENAAMPFERIRARVEHVAELYGLTDKLNAHPLELSGGQKQRLALASEIAGAPQIICLDEPFRGLDYDGVHVTQELLKTLRTEHHTIIIFTSRIPLQLRLLEPNQYLYLCGETARRFGSYEELDKDMSQQPIELQAYVTTGQELYVTQNVYEGALSHEGALASTFHQNTSPRVSAKGFTTRVHAKFTLGPLTFERTGPGVTAILGANGSGKTSFAKWLTWRQRRLWRSGKLRLEGRSIPVAYYMAQDSTRHFSQRLCVDELRGYGFDSSQILELFTKYGICEVIACDPLSIARPKQQLLALALAEASRADIVFLDEPTSCLDAAGVRCLAEAVMRYREAGRRVFLITHDIDFAQTVADDALVFDDGKIIYDGPTNIIVSKEGNSPNSSIAEA